MDDSLPTQCALMTSRRALLVAEIKLRARRLQVVAPYVAPGFFWALILKSGSDLTLCFYLAPRAGFEPATNRLTVFSGCFLLQTRANPCKRQKPLRHRAFLPHSRCMR